MSSYRCLRPRSLTHHIIFLQSLLVDMASPSAHTVQQTYWYHHAYPASSCRNLIKGWKPCWSQFAVRFRDTLQTRVCCLPLFLGTVCTDWKSLSPVGMGQPAEVRQNSSGQGLTKVRCWEYISSRNLIPVQAGIIWKLATWHSVHHPLQDILTEITSHFWDHLPFAYRWLVLLNYYLQYSRSHYSL